MHILVVLEILTIRSLQSLDFPEKRHLRHVSRRLINVRSKISDKIFGLCEYVEYEAVRKCVYLVKPILKILQKDYLLAGVDVDTAENERRKKNEPFKVCYVVQGPHFRPNRVRVL